MPELFDFEWGVDQDGYVLKKIRPGADIFARLLGVADEKDDPEQELEDEREGRNMVIRRCRGPLRFYRPMMQPGLWRRFADTVITPASALEFIREFGLLTGYSWSGLGFADNDPAAAFPEENAVGYVLDTARELREISRTLDYGERLLAATFFSRVRPPMAATINIPKPGARRLDLNIVPSDLRSALYLQAGNAITGDLKFRRCLNCPEWFQVGSGAHTVRRKFCSDRCRVSWSRKPAVSAAT